MDKYIHRRVTPNEFMRLLKGAKLALNDFLFLTGRSGHQVVRFLNEPRAPFTPTMGDVLVLELANDPDTLDKMHEIATRYSEGPTPKDERASAKRRKAS